MWISGIVVTLR